MSTEAKLGDLARIIRSKDSGNFHLTFDIVFEASETFARVLDSGVINEERLRELYQVPPDQAVDIVVFTPGLAIKVVIPRHFPSGGIDGVGEADLFGSNQHMPLLDIPVPDRGD